MNINQILNQLNILSSQGFNSQNKQLVIDLLDACINLFGHMTIEYEIPELRRITINKRILGSNKRISDINLLKYPPSKYVKKYGRCNVPNHSVLYGTTNSITALSEMRPSIGDLITTSTWISKNIKFNICPIFFVQPKGEITNLTSRNIENIFFRTLKKEVPSELQEAAINFNRFLAYHFSRPILPENDKDYLISGYFSNKILNKLNEGKVDAIMYPSVRSNLSFQNYAVKPEVFDSYFSLKEVTDSCIMQGTNSKFKGYALDGLGISKEFNRDEINWGNSVHQSSEKIEYLKEVYGLDLS